MDKKIAGLLGAAAALATVSGANATEVQGNAPNPAASYRDLLNPVPNALEALKTDDARLAGTPADEVKLAQDVITTIIIIITRRRASSSSRPDTATTTIITTITTTAAITATERRSDSAGSLAGPAFCRAQQVAIGAVEDGVGV